MFQTSRRTAASRRRSFASERRMRSRIESAPTASDSCWQFGKAQQSRQGTDSVSLRFARSADSLPVEKNKSTQEESWRRVLKLLRVVFAACRTNDTNYLLTARNPGSASLFDRIITARMEWMTTEYSTCGQCGTAQGSVTRDGVSRIFGTRGSESARRR